MATTERHKYTAAYLRILTVCLLIFFATFIFGRDHSTEIPVDVKTTKDTPLTVERWLQQQNQRKLKDTFAKAGIHPYVILNGVTIWLTQIFIVFTHWFL